MLRTLRRLAVIAATTLTLAVGPVAVQLVNGPGLTTNTAWKPGDACWPNGCVGGCGWAGRSCGM